MAEIIKEYSGLIRDLYSAVRRRNATDIACAKAALDWFYQDYPQFRPRA